MNELKPCPFCGGIPAVVEDGYKAIAVHCFNCGADITAESEKKARATWNRRAQPSNEPLTIEQLKQMDGEPVYIVTLENQLENTPYWAIVGISKNDSRYQGGVALYNKTQGDSGSFELYGKTWLAYDHKLGCEQE